MLGVSAEVSAADLPASGVQAVSTPTEEEAPAAIRFAIDHFIVDGAALLSQADFDQVVKPYVGQQKDFSDVQHALEAVEELYAKNGYSAVHVLLPEQELEAGTVHFQVIEDRYGKVIVKDNKFFSEASVLRAIPSVHPGGIPRAQQISRELKLANENPARQINVVLKAGEGEDEVDASVLVSDIKPDLWSINVDNTGSSETGRSRIGLSYRHANLFDQGHVGQVQMQVSPQYMDRVKVFGGSYKIPLFQSGRSVEFFVGYSNINSLVGGLSNFQGGGTLFSSRYNMFLERMGTFDSTLTLGADWRKFSKVALTNPPPITLYEDIVVTPLSVAYSAQGKAGKGDVNFNTSFVLNVPLASQGKSADFIKYDRVNMAPPIPVYKPNYKVIRFGAGYFKAFEHDWQFRTGLNGQWSGDTLIHGEQMRLGGAEGVRGFSEGSETGGIGARVNVETYTPAFEYGPTKLRGLVFVDAGAVKSKESNATSISSAGFGLRSGYGEQYSLRVDMGRIMKAGTDSLQSKGDWRVHATLSATF